MDGPPMPARPGPRRSNGAHRIDVSSTDLQDVATALPRSGATVDLLNWYQPCQVLDAAPRSVAPRGARVSTFCVAAGQESAAACTRQVAARGAKVQDQRLSEQIEALAQRLDSLGHALLARRDSEPARSPLEEPSRVDAATQALITQLTLMVLRLQRNVAELRGAGPTPIPCVEPVDTARASPPATIAESGNAHGVHFSRSHDHAVSAIVDLVDDAFAQGRPAIVVATGQHRRWIEADLHQRCIAFEGDTCRLLDADVTLSSLLVDGMPDRDRFRSIIGGLLADVCARNPGGVSVYGEMVGILWAQGDLVGAMRLEEYWNELQRELPFSLLCGYMIDGSSDHADLEPIRRSHTYVA